MAAVPAAPAPEEEINEDELIRYSERFYDSKFEYRSPTQNSVPPSLPPTNQQKPHPHPNNRHVELPRDLGKQLPQHRLLSEVEWRAIGIQQSRGWVHYIRHKDQAHILLFRR